MKRSINIIALFIFIFIFFDCKNKNDDIKLKFDSISKLDFSIYNDMQITKRNDTYFIEINSQSYKIKKNFLNKNISFLDRNGEKNIPKELKAKIEKLLSFYDSIEVLLFRVDKVGNVYFSIPWHDRCTYYFLRLAKGHTLDSINKKKYSVYDGSWYFDKECSVP
ncbi:hypothetical protein P1X15_21405 [Runella sp. MFBS21]|uniref:hypothetical protein n=1 Tax=Runella sp. MFBS21 TaxID=3034018 RepID=UPI0023F6DC92|nr:hypothetical protein [Runella sp. MFBS21]MDF7820191.1 hypothetical protein [Runella sp. MFBS21]